MEQLSFLNKADSPYIQNKSSLDPRTSCLVKRETRIALVGAQGGLGMESRISNSQGSHNAQ